LTAQDGCQAGTDIRNDDGSDVPNVLIIGSNNGPCLAKALLIKGDNDVSNVPKAMISEAITLPHSIELYAITQNVTKRYQYNTFTQYLSHAQNIHTLPMCTSFKQHLIYIDSLH
jgi:hypothetical protein